MMRRDESNHYLTRTGVEKDARPHIIRRSSSPVIPRFLNSCIVTFPTRCKSSEVNKIITTSVLRYFYR